MFNTSPKSSDFCLSNDVWLELTRRNFKKKNILKPIFHFYFLIQDFSLNMEFFILKLYLHVYNIHSEGTVSQHFKIGISLFFYVKKRIDFY